MRNLFLILTITLLASCKKTDAPLPPNNNVDTTTKPVVVNPIVNYYSTDTVKRYKGLIPMTAAQFASIASFDASSINTVAVNGKTTALPSSWSLPVQMVNQRDIPASAAFAAGFAVRSYNYFTAIYPNRWDKNGYLDTTKIFNPLFVYNQLPQNARRNFYDIFEFLKTKGIANAQQMPFYYVRDTMQQPTVAMQDSAQKYRTGQTYRLKKYDVNLIKRLLFTYDHPVVVGVTIDNAYQKLAKASFKAQGSCDTCTVSKIFTWYKYIQPGDASDNLAYDMEKTAQAMVITGFDDAKNAFQLWNPWGSLWGNGGFMWVDYNFLQEALMYNDYNGRPQDPYAFVITEPNKSALNDGLVAWFPFNGNTNDESGNGNNGILSSNVTLTADRDGRTGSNAIKFGGIAAPGTFTIKNSPSLQFLNDVSISFWIKVNSKNGIDWDGTTTTDNAKMNLFAKSAGTIGVTPIRSNYNGLTAFLEYNGTIPNCGINNKLWGQANYTGQELFYGFCGGSNSSFPTAWMHIAFVYKVGGESQLWVNGEAKMKSTVVSTGMAQAYLNDFVFSKDYPFNGEMDDIRIYNKALDQGQIYAIIKE